ncbi:hypothetical protein [Parasedimentitalea huanghaiensis]|uniref:Uncharacterized protein n=1 Tax=Parasedimentitalea huanghaiensis TaxID=2682100 RepID=A0A6L6WLC9_9RHOB|nr:hypothetical protein [Zongyanglinia huanghaiensis]MVO18271.1 hypothetical protein [Zongyanglinia huanghaiensis]
MSKDSTTTRVTSTNCDGVAPWTTPKTGLFDITGMTGMLIAAVVAALAVGALSLLIFMPGRAFTPTGASTALALMT